MRYLKNENPYIIARFTTSDTVKITIYDLSDDSKTVDNVDMVEIGSTGYFKYYFNPSPDVLTEYMYVANNTIEEHAGKIILGGYPDRILTATEIRQCIVNDISASTTKFITNLTETDNTFWVRAAVLFTSGDNDGQTRAIKDYTGNTKQITLQTPLNSAPVNGDTFIICAARKFLTPDLDEMADAVWDELKAEHTVADSFGDILDTKISSTGGCAVIGGLQEPEIKKLFKLLEKILKVIKNVNIKPLAESIAEIEESIQRKQKLLNFSFQKVEKQIKEIPQPINLKEDINVLQNALNILIECEEFKQITQEVKENVDVKLTQIEG